MAQLQIEKVKEDLRQEGFTSEQTEKVQKAIQANLPPETYNKAVLFLGWATVALTLGSIILAILGKTVPEALWGALGAGIGGLAGIFMGKQ
jgi:hypothetical protein